MDALLYFESLTAILATSIEMQVNFAAAHERSHVTPPMLHHARELALASIRILESIEKTAVQEMEADVDSLLAQSAHVVNELSNFSKQEPDQLEVVEDLLVKAKKFHQATTSSLAEQEIAVEKKVSERFTALKDRFKVQIARIDAM